MGPRRAPSPFTLHPPPNSPIPCCNAYLARQGHAEEIPGGRTGAGGIKAMCDQLIEGPRELRPLLRHSKVVLHCGSSSTSLSAGFVGFVSRAPTWLPDLALEQGKEKVRKQDLQVAEPGLGLPGKPIWSRTTAAAMRGKVSTSPSGWGCTTPAWDPTAACHETGLVAAVGEGPCQPPAAPPRGR
jgi:hypothetical protein